MIHSTNVLTYGCSTNDQKKDGFLRLIVFTIVKITSTDKEIFLLGFDSQTDTGKSNVLVKKSNWHQN